jgi:hypothetical protein
MASTACESRIRPVRSNPVRLLAALLLLGFVACDVAWADDRRGPDVDVVLPVEPREHERLQWFGRRGHHLVPGTVTINRAPYVCEVEGGEFRQRDEFVAHLRLVHGVAVEEIADAVVLTDGQIRFPAEK